MNSYVYALIGMVIIYFVYSRNSEKKSPYVFWIISVPLVFILYRQLSSDVPTEIQGGSSIHNLEVSSDVMSLPFPNSSDF